MEKKVKIGIIGAGGRANFQTKSIIGSGLGEPLIVATPFEDEAKKFSEKYNIKYSLNWEEVCKKPEIDAIVVSTPNATHYPIVKNALLNNKHVLVEYPPSLSIEEVDDLIEIAKEKGLVFWVSLTQLLENPHYTVKKNIELIGRPFSVYYSCIYSSLGGWYADKKLAGPLFTWQHYHFVSQIYEIWKELDEVYATENIEYLENGIMSSTFSTIVIRFKTGLLGYIEFGMGIKGSKDFKFRMVGEEGILYYEEGKIYFVSRKEGKKQIQTEEISLAIDTENFLNQVIKNTVNIEKAILAKEILKICLMARKSAKENKIVKW